jgi:phospholipid/cholesterol/gamma-HCH transport system permease protein
MSSETLEHSPPAPRALAKLRAPLAAFVRDLAGLYGLLRSTLHYVARGKLDREAVIAAAHNTGNGSMLFVSITMGVVGMITVLQSGLQTQRVLPELSLLGANIIQILAREFAPTVCALMLATRVGAGIAAEIGSMVVTDQVDALRMCGADPVDYLVVPRFIASVVMTTALAWWSLFVAVATGSLAANLVFDLNYGTFINFSLVGFGDLAVMTAKAVVYGSCIPIVSARRGLTTFGGSEGVGWATTNAVVHSSLAIIFFDLVLSVLGYVVFPPV